MNCWCSAVLRGAARRPPISSGAVRNLRGSGSAFFCTAIFIFVLASIEPM
jgi:hypothetical protein